MKISPIYHFLRLDDDDEPFTLTAFIFTGFMTEGLLTLIFGAFGGFGAFWALILIGFDTVVVVLRDVPFP